ncbi:SURF1-like protein [Novimethylophilus kurashikiensis]|uniref:SURF1-like protein n=1 Tax=Novimethylophilus kurashikiensis TaxID=1825523 RepID=A0A2R5F9C5_9PROT|nr:DUF1987 domain-containing protein [Novimethylophilus kurashikiensis]GBG13234.1 SURF1-like protein [Novimethylophilus kurashikiensis]
MNDLYLARTAHSPEVDFRFSSHELTLTGEAYPENAADFFQPLLSALEGYLRGVDGQEIHINFRLTYFNSAATKMLYSMFELLNETACTSNRVILNWFHDEEDDTILEFGEGVHDDFSALDFRPVAVDLATA